jgi:hypothetical protein
MVSSYLAVAIKLISTQAFAQDKVANNAADPAVLSGCPPIGQTAKGELIYSLDCKAIKTGECSVGRAAPGTHLQGRPLLFSSLGPFLAGAKSVRRSTISKRSTEWCDRNSSQGL